MEQTANITVKFSADDPPRITNRSDALELLDLLIKADSVENNVVPLVALKDAVEREII
jgi:hypothetical protein